MYNWLIENKELVLEFITIASVVMGILFILGIVLDAINLSVSKNKHVAKLYMTALRSIEFFAGNTLRQLEIKIACFFVNLFSNLYKWALKLLTAPIKNFLEKIFKEDIHNIVARIASIVLLLPTAIAAVIVFFFGFNKISIITIIILIIAGVVVAVLGAVGGGAIVGVGLSIAVGTAGVVGLVGLATGVVGAIVAGGVVGAVVGVMVALGALGALGEAVLGAAALGSIIAVPAIVFVYLQKLAGASDWLALVYSISIFLIMAALLLIPDKKYWKWIKMTLATIAISITFSLIALLLVNYVLPGGLSQYLNTFWFQQTTDGLIQTTSKGNFLLLWNFPFDFLTIMITIWLLRTFIVKRHERNEGYIPIIGVAVVDFITSILLTVSLHTFLKIIQNGWAFANIAVYFSESGKWFGQVTHAVFLGSIDKLPESVLSDIHLYPILITTFIPVFVYTSCTFAVSCGKLSLWSVTKIFSLKEKDFVFTKLLAIIFGVIIALLGLIIALVGVSSTPHF